MCSYPNWPFSSHIDLRPCGSTAPYRKNITTFSNMYILSMKEAGYISVCVLEIKFRTWMTWNVNKTHWCLLLQLFGHITSFHHFSSLFFCLGCQVYASPWDCRALSQLNELGYDVFAHLWRELARGWSCRVFPGSSWGTCLVPLRHIILSLRLMNIIYIYNII